MFQRIHRKLAISVSGHSDETVGQANSSFILDSKLINWLSDRKSGEILVALNVKHKISDILVKKEKRQRMTFTQPLAISNPTVCTSENKVLYFSSLIIPSPSCCLPLLQTMTTPTITITTKRGTPTEIPTIAPVFRAFAFGECVRGEYDRVQDLEDCGVRGGEVGFGVTDGCGVGDRDSVGRGVLGRGDGPGTQLIQLKMF
jgi:hypothetical protein